LKSKKSRLRSRKQKNLCAGVAKLADALDLGSSSRKGMGVRVPSPAPFYPNLRPEISNLLQNNIMKLSAIFLSALLAATSSMFCSSQQAPKPKEGQFGVLFNWSSRPHLYERYVEYASLIIPRTIDALHAEIVAEVKKSKKDCKDVAFIHHNGGQREYWFKYPPQGVSFPDWLRKGLNDYTAYAPGGDLYRSTSSSASSASTASSSTSALAKTTAGSASSSSSATATPTSSALASQAPAACAASAAAAAAQASTALIAPAKK
jgi:hypothetical protein